MDHQGPGWVSRILKSASRWAMALALAVAAAGSLAQTRDPVPAPASGALEPITPIPTDPSADTPKVALGQKLFEDPRLSGDGSRSCLSCHDTHTNGAAPPGAATGPDGRPLPLDTTTIFNAGLRPLLNWTGAYRTLEEQAKALIENPSIMNSTVATVVDRLRADPAMTAAFEYAYGRPPDEAPLLDALAAYERSLTTPGSRFDRWLEGDKSRSRPRKSRAIASFRRWVAPPAIRASMSAPTCSSATASSLLWARRSHACCVCPACAMSPSHRPTSMMGGPRPSDQAVRGMARAQLGRALSDEQVANIVAFLQTLTGTYQQRQLAASR